MPVPTLPRVISAPMAPPPRKRADSPAKWLKDRAWATGRLGLTIVAALVIASGACEIILGLFDLGQDEYIKPDPVLGVTHLENKPVTFRLEGFARQKISSIGTRDVEHAAQKPDGVKRIIFLGDSKTEALQVPLADTFAKKIESRLSAGGKKVETLNFAMASYSTVQEYLSYLLRGKSYKPDVTILLYNYLDSSENTVPLGMTAVSHPFASLDREGRLRITFDYIDRWMQKPMVKYTIATEWLRRHCHLYQTFLANDLLLRSNNKTYNNLCQKLEPAFDVYIKTMAGLMPEPRLGDYARVRQGLIERTERLDKDIPNEVIWQAPDDGSINVEGDGGKFRLLAEMTRSNFHVTARLIQLLNRACREDGSKLVVVALPVPGGFCLYQKEIRLLKKIAQKEGFQVIDTNPSFPKLQVMEKNPYYYSAHLTPRGHQTMADIILSEIDLPF